MPTGPGSYGKKRGRPPKKKKEVVHVGRGRKGRKLPTPGRGKRRIVYA